MNKEINISKNRAIQLLQSLIEIIKCGIKITDHRGIVWKQEFGEKYLEYLEQEIEGL